MRINKIIFNPEDNTFTTGKKAFKDLPKSEQDIIVDRIRNFIIKNTKMSDYEEDCMWMSYRYCIGRHTIASAMHANDIWKNCRGRMSKERELFTAFDINRSIEDSLQWIKPYFHFPLTSLNRIYGTAVDIVCEFMEEYNINSIEEFNKYRDVDVILTDNERGYKFETTTWEEWLRPQVYKIVSKYYDNSDMSEELTWKYFESWKSGKEITQNELIDAFKKLTIDMPNKEYYNMYAFEDLFVWNDLVHCFDYEHHHKSILENDEEVEWFWSWTNKSVESKDEPGKYYYTFGYKRIRVPVDKWNGSITTYIPDEIIKEDLY